MLPSLNFVDLAPGEHKTLKRILGAARELDPMVPSADADPPEPFTPQHAGARVGAKIDAGEAATPLANALPALTQSHPPPTRDIPSA